MCRNVDIVMTFDDGPHSGNGAGNHTRQIIETLADNPTAPGIHAVFFIQSHAQLQNGAHFRGMHANGRAVLEEALAAGHLVQIHTGADMHGAHLSENYHPERLEAGELVNDLDRCTEFIEGLDDGDGDDDTHHEVEFVRPPGGDYFDPPDTNVLPTYTDEGLKMTLWDVDPQDWDADNTPADIAASLYNQVKNAVEGGASELVVLLHDVGSNTHESENLELYIDKIDDAVKDAGENPVWVHTEERIREILRDKSWVSSDPNH